MTIKPSSIPKYLRILIPSILLVVWLTVGAIGGPYFGKISDVVSNDQATFLPASAESTKVASELEKFQDESSIPAIVVFDDDGAQLSGETIDSIRAQTGPLQKLDGAVGGVSPPVVSEDKKAAFVIVAMDSSYDYGQFSQAIHTELDQADIALSYAVTGPVGFLDDLSQAFAGIDGLLLGVALVVVFVILLIVYRSPILPFLVLTNSMIALCASILIVYYLTKLGIVSLNGQVQGILSILVIGAATDYALLFVARYKEELKAHSEPYEALLISWRRSVEPIVAAGGTVIAGLLCLLLSDLSSNQALGPVGAIGIALAIISALTLLPSLLLMWGRKVFWPRMPRYQQEVSQRVGQGIWLRVADFVRNHTRATWIVTGAALIVCSFGVLQLKADGVAQSEFVLGTSEARDGQAIIDKHFPGGSGTPAYVIVPEEKLDSAVQALEADQGVASVSVRADDSPSGSLPLGRAAQDIKDDISRQIPQNLPNRESIIASAYPFRDATVKTVEGEVLLEVTLQDAADSDAALASIERLRTDLRPISENIRVGGTSAIQLDTRVSSARDRAVVIPAVLIVITIILMFLLRSILAPIILLGTTLISFTATLGIAALVFNHLFGFVGADPSVVMYGFIFLVALGIDYNIFLMTRVREESLQKGTRRGTLRGLIATGGVITSAGVVLAATFAALAVIPILFLVQLAFIVAVGVLIDTIIVRSLLVPALAHDIGNKIWWPSKKFTDKNV